MLNKTREQWYLELTKEPKIVGNLLFTFQPPLEGTNLAELEIDNLKSTRMMLSEYLIDENASEIRLTYIRNDRKIAIKDDTKFELMGQYMFLPLYDFERLLNAGLFSVEEIEW